MHINWVSSVCRVNLKVSFILMMVCHYPMRKEISYTGSLSSTTTNSLQGVHSFILYKFVHVCTCVYTCVHVCACMCMCVHVCTCVCMYVYVCACMCMCAYVCACKYVCVHVCMCVHVCVCVYMCVYGHPLTCLYVLLGY